MRVTVVGAGVVGLTCAVRLLEEGHRVDVLARDLPLETTSAVAAAIWYPYRSFPFDRVLAWSARAYDVFAGLAGIDGAGVTMRSGIEVFAARQDEPWWRSAVPALDHVPPPAGYGDAWTFEAPVVEMPVYLTWLASRVEELGGTITRLNVSALPVGPDVVVNCSGIGARLLAADSSVGPGAARSRTSRRSAWSGGTSTPPPTSRTSCLALTTSWSGAPTRRASGAAPRPPATPRPSSRGPPAGAGTESAAVLRHRVGLAPLARRYEWSGWPAAGAAWCTATATVARASR